MVEMKGLEPSTSAVRLQRALDFAGIKELLQMRNNAR